MCIAIIEVTYRNDQTTDEPVLIKVTDRPVSAFITELKDNDSVLKFKVFVKNEAFVRKERWTTVCNA